MFVLQNKSRPISIGEASIQDRGARIDSQNDKALIFAANSTNLLEILNQYQINIDEYNRKAICPFPSHSVDRTASFFYYKDTNSFYCFGCKNGGGPCNFVSIMDGISRADAAKKINSNSFSQVRLVRDDNYNKCQSIVFAFSSIIREFIQSNADDIIAIEYAEKLTLIFDTMVAKHKLDANGLASLIDKIKFKIEHYKI